MSCPFLRTARVRYCHGPAVRKPIVDAPSSEQGRCSSAAYRECVIYKEHSQTAEGDGLRTLRRPAMLLGHEHPDRQHEQRRHRRDQEHRAPAERRHDEVRDRRRQQEADRPAGLEQARRELAAARQPLATYRVQRFTLVLAHEALRRRGS